MSRLATFLIAVLDAITEDEFGAIVEQAGQLADSLKG